MPPIRMVAAGALLAYAAVAALSAPAGAQPKPRIEWSHRRLVGTEGFVEVRLGTEGRAHLFAIDT